MCLNVAVKLPTASTCSSVFPHSVSPPPPISALTWKLYDSLFATFGRPFAFVNRYLLACFFGPLILIPCWLFSLHVTNFICPLLSTVVRTSSSPRVVSRAHFMSNFPSLLLVVPSFVYNDALLSFKERLIYSVSLTHVLITFKRK